LSDPQEYLVEHVMARATEQRPQELKLLDEVLAGNLVTISAFPAHQLPYHQPP